MLEKINKVLLECNQKRLEQQCENEDTSKKDLFNSAKEAQKEQYEKRKALNKVLEQRKNLYIYPEQVNV